MTKRTTAALLVAVCAVLSSCGGRASTVLAPNTAAVQPIALPSPIAAIPVFAVKIPDGTGRATIKHVTHIPGVAVATGIRLGKETVRSPDGRERLRVAAVDPLSFRPLALPSARDASFVWTSLLGDQTVVSYDAARRLHIAGGESLRLKDGSERLVGAFADTGVPNIADVLVSRRVGISVGLRKTNIVEVGAEPGASLDNIAKGIHRVLPGVALHRLIAQPPPVLQPSEPQPFGVAQGSIIGTMHYLIQKNGFIKPDPAWVSAFIVNANVPLLGTVTCNRLMVPQLAAALGEVERKGLAAAIDPGDYGGCYVPRFVDRNPSLPLSMHAFGLAIDLNVSENPLGTAGHMDPRVVKIFEKWGFRWGGNFAPRPDPMHFEVERLVQP